MTKICLVRHGETDWNHAGILQGQQNISLNSKGREQAKATGKYLAANEEAFDMLITSSLNRAKETAKIINHYLQLPLLEMDAFQERAFGAAEGLSKEERQRKYPRAAYPDAEKETAFYSRVMKGFAEITVAYADQHILLISHGLVINLILSSLLKEEINYKKTALLNGCINHIQLINNTWQVQSLNQMNHLTGIGREKP